MWVTSMLAPSLAFFVAACSGKPTVDDVAREFATTHKDCPGIETLDLSKVNGEEGDDDRHYSIEVSYKVRVADVDKICGDKDSNNFARLAFINMAQQHGVKFQNGLVIPVQEVKQMKKTENGWVFDSDGGSE